MTRTLTALGTALLLAGASAAYAQTGTGTATSPSGNPPASVNKGAESTTGGMQGTSGTQSRDGTQKHQGAQAGGAVKNPPGAESTTSNVTGGTAFDRSAVGQTVYDRDGEAIGKVKSVDGNRITVSVGSYLGVGSRDISLGRSQMDTKTSTNNKLVTTLNKQELAAQPEAGKTGASINTGSSTGGNRSDATGSSKPMQRDGTSSTTTSPKQ